MSTELIAKIDNFTLRADHYRAKTAPKNMTLFCLPGGGLAKGYFDLAPNFSFTDRMCALGYDVITMDHPGIASNPMPDNHAFYTPRDAAGYTAKALKQWNIQAPIIGVGHSLGGMMIMLMQGAHSPFKALGLFGSSAGGLDWGLSDEEKAYINKPDDFAHDLEALSLTKFGRAMIPATNGPSGESIVFGGETLELTARLGETACEMNAAGAMMSMMRGSFRKEVEAIDVPIFFAFGDHDIGIPSKDVPKDFINAARTETLILDATGHNHFAFSSIEPLCKKLDTWIAKL